MANVWKMLRPIQAPRILHRSFSASPATRWRPPPPDYQPQFGDYPNLPWSSFDSRSPYRHWDDPVHRRNFGETIPEEFDVQDAWFQGEHDPWKQLKEGLEGQLAIGAILGTSLLIAYLIHNPEWKTPLRVPPPEVAEYLANEGMQYIRPRPYEYLKTSMAVTHSLYENTPSDKA